MIRIDFVCLMSVWWFGWLIVFHDSLCFTMTTATVIIITIDISISIIITWNAVIGSREEHLEFLGARCLGDEGVVGQPHGAVVSPCRVLKNLGQFRSIMIIWVGSMPIIIAS